MQTPKEIGLRYNGVCGTVASDEVRLLGSKHKIDFYLKSQMAQLGKGEDIPANLGKRGV